MTRSEGRREPIGAPGGCLIADERPGALETSPSPGGGGVIGDTVVTLAKPPCGGQTSGRAARVGSRRPPACPSLFKLAKETERLVLRHGIVQLDLTVREAVAHETKGR
jgi:hypothetical protein